jgi:hypothetical protein
VRRAEPNLAIVQTLADRVFPRTAHLTVERVAEGVSTYVYRIRRGAETFYLRVLPEADASFAPEVRAHALLRARGVAVPEVIYFEHCNAALQRSVMVTTEIPGSHFGHRAVDRDTRDILAAAGRDLAVVNSLAVEGFGWIKRDRGEAPRLEAEHPTYRDFVHEHLEQDLALLRERVLTPSEVAVLCWRQVTRPRDCQSGQVGGRPYAVTTQRDVAGATTMRHRLPAPTKYRLRSSGKSWPNSSPGSTSSRPCWPTATST